MNEIEYHKILDDYCDWFLGSSAMLVAEPIKDRKNTDGKYDRQPPEAGHYPVVRSLKKEGGPCGWCGEHTNAERFYIRESDSNLWKARCKDKDCRRKLILHTSQIGKESQLITCPLIETSK